MAEPLQFLIRSAFDASGVTSAVNSVRSIDSQINKVSRGFNQLMGLMGAGGIGAALFSFGKNSVMEFAKSEAGVSKLTKALQNLGTFTAGDVKIQTDFAKQLQLTTKYSDEDIMAIQAQLVTYGLYGDKLKQATQATLDLATKTGSTETASKLMGKAFQGQTDTLARYGIKIDANTSGSAKFDAVLNQVQKRLGGMAENEGATFEGQMARVGHQFEELQEKIGQKLMPVALTWSRWLSATASFIEKNFSPQESAELKGIDLTIQGLKDKIKFGNYQIQQSQYVGITDTAHYKTLIENQDKYTAALKRVQTQKIAAGMIAPSPGKPTIPESNLDDEKMQAAENEILAFGISEKEKMYTRFFGAVNIKRRQNLALEGKTAEQLKINNKNMLRTMELDYAEAGRTFSGGFKQAFQEMEYAGLNWKQGFEGVISGALGPASSAIHDFFTMTSDGFARIDKLAKGIFQGILNSFLSMLEQMAAKAAIYGFLSFLFPSSSFLSKGLGSFLGFAEGGPVPGREGSPVPILAHGGEFMLSANVVKAIKAGTPTSGLSGGALAAAGAGANINYSPTININGGVNGGNVREICKQIADAGRKGVTEALDAAKVLYKQGAKRSGETAL